ncbi:MAG TPA: hypothetical protein VNL13_06615 [Sulfolobales archaeon]|nr:hypothetical protein [Sulfolobales archaeon]
MVVSRDFCLTRRVRDPVGSWVAVEPKGTWLLSRISLGRFGAMLP